MMGCMHTAVDVHLWNDFHILQARPSSILRGSEGVSSANCCWLGKASLPTFMALMDMVLCTLHPKKRTHKYVVQRRRHQGMHLPRTTLGTPYPSGLKNFAWLVVWRPQQDQRGRVCFATISMVPVSEMCNSWGYDYKQQHWGHGYEHEKQII